MRVNRANRIRRSFLSAVATFALVVGGLVAPGLPFTDAAEAAATSQTFTNPVGGQGQDPDIRYIDGFYYYVQATSPDASNQSTPGNTITLRRSPSLASLDAAPIITLWTPGQGGTPSDEVWAPEIVKFGSTWYVYFTAGAGSAHRTYVISSSSPIGGYSYAGRLYDPANDYWSIDPHVFNNNGSYYLVYSGWPYANSGNQSIYIVGMDSPTHVNTSRSQLSTPTYSWEGPVNEGPTTLVHNGTIYLVYSANGCWTPDYSLGQLSAPTTANLLSASSWTKSPTPIFQRNDAAGVYGPGHNGFFTSPDGTEQWISYHAVTSSAGNCGPPRTVRAQSFTWNSNGSPALGVPLGLSTSQRLPSGDPGSTGVVSVAGSKCMDVAGNDTGGNGATVQVWDCVAGAQDQQWTLQSDGTLRTLGQCLDISGGGTTATTPVDLWACNGQPNQVWTPQPNGSLVNPQSGLCLDVPGDNSTNGTPLQIYTCLGNANQQIAVPGWAASISAPGGKCVDINGTDQTTNGLVLQLWDCPAVTEVWTPAFDGTIRYANKCMDVYGNVTTNDAAVDIWDCNGQANQQWIRQADGSIMNPASGRCLDDPNGNTGNGTQLRIHDCNGSVAQKFRVNG